MHKLEYIEEHETYEEYLCPNCGRRILIDWEDADIVVLNPGNIEKNHMINKGIELFPPEIKQESLWSKLLDKMGFDKLWQ